jgi:hypothetical protein
VLPDGNDAVPDKETNKNIQPRRTYLPLFLSNFIHRIAGVILWFIPQSIQRWWSPLHSRRPIGKNTVGTLFSSDVIRTRTSLIACPDCCHPIASYSIRKAIGNIDLVHGSSNGLLQTPRSPSAFSCPRTSRHQPSGIEYSTDLVL